MATKGKETPKVKDVNKEDYRHSLMKAAAYEAIVLYDICYQMAGQFLIGTDEVPYDHPCFDDVLRVTHDIHEHARLRYYEMRKRTENANDPYSKFFD